MAKKTAQPKMEEWEVENAADTLMKAEEIKEDKKMMKAASKVLDERKVAINKVNKSNFPYK